MTPEAAKLILEEIAAIRALLVRDEDMDDGEAVRREKLAKDAQWAELNRRMDDLKIRQTKWLEKQRAAKLAQPSATEA